MSDPIEMIRPRRQIAGMSAILLPFTDDGAVDWDGFCAHVARTADAGLTPAVNMDTGFVNLLDDATRREVLARTRDALGGRMFVAGAFVGDQPGDPWDPDAYRCQIEQIQAFGGIPVIFNPTGWLVSRAKPLSSPTLRWGATAHSSSPLSWERCSRRSAKSTISKRMRRCSACHRASARNIRRSAAQWNGSVCACATAFIPISKS